MPGRMRILRFGQLSDLEAEQAPRIGDYVAVKVRERLCADTYSVPSA